MVWKYLNGMSSLPFGDDGPLRYESPPGYCLSLKYPGLGLLYRESLSASRFSPLGPLGNGSPLQEEENE